MLPLPSREGAGGRGPQSRLNIGARQTPRIVQLSHDVAHEVLGQRQRALRIAEVVSQQRQRQLPWTVALIGPLEAHPAETADVETRVQQLTIDRHHRAIETAAALVDLHAKVATPALSAPIASPGAWPPSCRAPGASSSASSRSPTHRRATARHPASRYSPPEGETAARECCRHRAARTYSTPALRGPVGSRPAAAITRPARPVRPRAA